MRAPEFWSHDGWASRLLAPVGAAYGAVSRIRMATRSRRSASLPVVCIGNLVAGGAGKTPVAIALARSLIEIGMTPHILSRGYGGGERGPLRVDPARHTAAEVGDESLLLASAAPTWVGADRYAGAGAAMASGADIVVMDDGYQNATLAKDLSLVVIDGGYGFGNGRVMPAGPLRESPGVGLARADGIVLVGDDRTNVMRLLPVGMPLIGAQLVPDHRAYALFDQPVYAFAGIGRPSKFFETLEGLGCRLVGRRAFGDHHRYDSEEIMALVEAAAALGATLVTTEKDQMRLPRESWRMVTVVRVDLEWQDGETLKWLLEKKIGRG